MTDDRLDGDIALSEFMVCEYNPLTATKGHTALYELCRRALRETTAVDCDDPVVMAKRIYEVVKAAPAPRVAELQGLRRWLVKSAEIVGCSWADGKVSPITMLREIDDRLACLAALRTESKPQEPTAQEIHDGWRAIGPTTSGLTESAHSRGTSSTGRTSVLHGPASHGAEEVGSTPAVPPISHAEPTQDPPSDRIRQWSLCMLDEDYDEGNAADPDEVARWILRREPPPCYGPTPDREKAMAESLAHYIKLVDAVGVDLVTKDLRAAEKERDEAREKLAAAEARIAELEARE